MGCAQLRQWRNLFRGLPEHIDSHANWRPSSTTFLLTGGFCRLRSLPFLQLCHDSFAFAFGKIFPYCVARLYWYRHLAFRPGPPPLLCRLLFVRKSKNLGFSRLSAILAGIILYGICRYFREIKITFNSSFFMSGNLYANKNRLYHCKVRHPI